jgi:hypothetical protein
VEAQGVKRCADCAAVVAWLFASKEASLQAALVAAKYSYSCALLWTTQCYDEVSRVNFLNLLWRLQQ